MPLLIRIQIQMEHQKFFSLPSIHLSHLLLSFFSHETLICRRITKNQAKKELKKRYINGIRVTIDHSRSSNQQGEWCRIDARPTDVSCGRVSKELYAPALGGIMLSIGIGLSIEDFALAFKRPLPLSIGFIARYVVKPVLGVLIAKAFGFPRMFYAGFVLMACVSGAQLSTYASFISKGDVALCIVLTSYTTIASVILTPLLTGLLIGSVVPVDAVAMICTSLCIGSPLAINRSQILSGEDLRLVFPVLIFHAAAFTLGYWFSNLPPLRYVPPACSVVAMAIMGLCLASFWGKGFEIRNLLSSLPPLRSSHTLKCRYLQQGPMFDYVPTVSI